MRSLLLALCGLVLAVATASPSDAQRRLRGDRHRAAPVAATPNLGERLAALRSAPSRPFATAFTLAACAERGPMAALCTDEAAADAFERAVDPLRPLGESLRTLVDLGQLTRDDARALRVLVGEHPADVRETARHRLLNSPRSTARVLTTSLGDAMDALEDAATVASTADGAAEMLGCLAAGAADGAVFLETLGRSVAAGMDSFLESLTEHLVAVLIVAVTSGVGEGGESDRSDDDDEDDGTTEDGSAITDPPGGAPGGDGGGSKP